MPHILRMVSIGIDRYKYFPAAKLDFASSDAREIANAFRECTDLPLETGSPYVLTNAEATRLISSRVYVLVWLLITTDVSL